MGKWVIIWGAIALIGWLISAGISANQRSNARKHTGKAKELLASGDWEGAAALYKKAILERLDNRNALEGLTRELSDIYAGHGVEADLTRILEAPELMKQVWKTNAAPKEKGRLTGKLYGEIAQVLEKYPGKLEG